MPRKIIATPEKEKEAKKVFYALSHDKTYDDLAKENNTRDPKNCTDN